MFLNFRENAPLKSFELIAFLVVCLLWISLAVRSEQCLRFISRSAIPYTRRTIWLLKILALIIGAGGIVGLAVSLGTPWFLAVLPGGIVVFFALRENVQDVVPLKPPQDVASYQLAWQEYSRLRNFYMRSWIWFGTTFGILVLAVMVSSKLPQVLQLSLLGICFVAVVASMFVTSFNHYKLQRWPCPRCGCAFRGLWGRPWLPKRCVYCGLARWEEISGRASSQ